MPQTSLGILETRGYTGIVEAIDAMLKAADVEIVNYEKVGGGLVSVCISGDVGAVRVALDSGQIAASKAGEATSALIPNPSRELLSLLNAGPDRSPA